MTYDPILTNTVQPRVPLRRRAWRNGRAHLTVDTHNDDTTTVYLVSFDQPLPDANTFRVAQVTTRTARWESYPRHRHAVLTQLRYRIATGWAPRK